jgi:hypothetical protein
MKKNLLWLELPLMKGLIAVLVFLGVSILLSCSDDNGLTEGDPNYFTSSRGQFTATLSDGTTLYLIPGSIDGTATVTFDGDKPLHWQSETSTNVNVTTYQGDLIIPETVTGSDGNTYTITAIGDEAFMGCRLLTSVQLPNTVQTLGEGAFAICQELISANIPEGVTELPVGCFGNCRALTSVTLPTTLKTINRMAFYGCVALETTSFTLPEGLETIGDQTFSECTGSKFTEITIPSTVTRIGDKAFGGRKSSYRPRIATYYIKAMTPPVLEGILYEERDNVNPIIKVPVGAKEAYEAAAGWSSLTIEEE